jgi:hypothetical protein
MTTPLTQTGKGISVPCVMCKTEIPIGAKICGTCNSYQATWRNRLQYIGTMVGVITLIGSMLTYVITSFPTIRTTFFYKDKVHVTAFNSRHRIIISNSGDGGVFVSHLDMQSESPLFSSVLHIHQPIEKGGFLTHKISEPEDHAGDWEAVHFINEQQWKSLVDQSQKEWFSPKCYKWIFYTLNDPGFQNMARSMKDHLEVAPLVWTVSASS